MPAPLPARLLDRLRPGPTALRRLALASLVANAGIVVTGAAVRVTGSGLGCPTWPRCSATSFVPQQALGAHGLIEFSNRMLTFVLGLVVVATILATLLRRPWRRDLSLLAGSLFLGIVAQAVLGGVTVRTGLNPLTVAAHLLVSMVILVGAVALHLRAGEPAGTPRPLVRRELVGLSRLLVGVAASVLVLGTLVTGTGPHSGDPRARRLPFDPVEITQVHADLVFLLVGLVVAMCFALWALGAPAVVRRRALVLVAVVLGQGVIGYVQYFTGLPAGVVAAHVLGATLVWISTLRLHLGLWTRAPGPAVAPAAPREVLVATA